VKAVSAVPAPSPVTLPAVGTPISESARPEKQSAIETPISEPVRSKKQTPAASEAVAPKTYSDEEILASVKPEPRKSESGASKPQPFYGRVSPAKSASKKSEKPDRRTPPEQTRLHINIGEEMGIAPIDIVNAIAGETGLPGKVVGKVDIRERHLFVDVASEHTNAIIAKLNRASVKGHKLKVKTA
jgi:ATP-dependent RNA helicase DeaD